MQLSEYEIYKDAHERLNSLSHEQEWNTLDLDPHEWAEIKCWFSYLDADTEEEVIMILQQLAGSISDNNPSGIAAISTKIPGYRIRGGL